MFLILNKFVKLLLIDAWILITGLHSLYVITLIFKFQPDTSSEDLENLRQQMVGLKSTLDEVSRNLFSCSGVEQVLLNQLIKTYRKFNS